MESIPADGPSDMNDGVAKPKYQKHEIESMANDIMRAHEHMADPEIMKLVKPHLDKKVKAIRSISDLKKRAADSSASGGVDPEESEGSGYPGKV